MMRRILAVITALTFGMCGIAHAQTTYTPQVLQWQYSFDSNGQAKAYYPGSVSYLSGPTGLPTNNPTFTGTLTGPTISGSNVSATVASPSAGNQISTVSILLNRVVSVEDNAATSHSTSADNTAAFQSALNSVAAIGGGNVLVGPYSYYFGGTVNPSIQPTAAQYNTSGFTLSIPNTSAYAVGQGITLTGFTAPFTQLNGSWTVSVVNTGSIVVLTGLTGTQSSTSTGLGTVYFDLTVPTGVNLVCPKPLSGSINTYSTWGSLPYTLVTNGNYPIILNNGAGIVGCNVIGSTIANNVVSSETARQLVSDVNSWVGSGIEPIGGDSQIENVLIIGYNIGVNAQSAARLRITHLNVDATNCVNTNQSYDISHYYDVHCQSFYNANLNSSTTSWPVTNVANNGSGLWRVTTTAASTLQAGDSIFISGVVGAASVNNQWTIAAVGAGYIDLTGSSATGVTPTATLTGGAGCLKSLSSTANIGIGDGITGTNIQGSTTVTDVLAYDNAICLSNNLTGSASGETVTITPSAYTSGGTVYLDTYYRTGYGLSWTNGETNACTDCFAINHAIGFYMGAGASWTSLTSVKTDGSCADQNKSSIGFWMDSSQKGTFINGGSTQCQNMPVLVSSTTNSEAIQLSNMDLNCVNSHVFELSKGRLMAHGNTSSCTAGFVGDNANFLGYTDNDFNINWEVTSITGASVVNLTGNSLGSQGFSGNANIYGNVNLGSTSIGLANGNVSVKSPLFMIGSSGPYGSYTIPASTPSWRFTGTVTGGTYNVQLPYTISGLYFPIFFDTAVTTLTWTPPSGTVAAAPSSVTAGQLVICAVSNNTSWYCR